MRYWRFNLADIFIKFTGIINRRLPSDEGEASDPIVRENWLARDGVLKKPQGNESVVTDLGSIPRWIQRYSSIESSVVSPKTFVYTENGKIRVLDDNAGTSSEVKDQLNTNAYPKSQLFKTGEQNKMFIVDGEGLYSHDGNNDNTFIKVDLVDSDGNSVEPIDVIEHKDRLIVISKTSIFISKNLEPEVFDDATDSIQIIVGSGRGSNLALGKIEDKLYIFNSEGIYGLDGDVISALASTFEVRLVDERKIIAGRTAVTVEKAIVFLADDFELWSWNGSTSELLTYELKLKDFVNTYRDKVDKATAIYENNYYKMSFVQKGDSEPNVEVWWDAFENKCDIVKGRHVACSMKTDPNTENQYVQLGMSNKNTITQDYREALFNGDTIATRLRTRDITPKSGQNGRFLAFYPKFSPTGNRDIIIRYLLDGRLSNPTDTAHFTHNLRGETTTLGFIEITNQGQFTGRYRPKIKCSRGESVAFEIIEATASLKADFLGMGIDFLAKFKSKGSKVGA